MDDREVHYQLPTTLEPTERALARHLGSPFLQRDFPNAILCSMAWFYKYVENLPTRTSACSPSIRDIQRGFINMRVWGLPVRLSAI